MGAFEAIVLVAFALFVALIVVFASTLAHAATPVETCPSHTGWMIGALAIGLFAGANVGFVALALFSHAGEQP